MHNHQAHELYDIYDMQHIPFWQSPIVYGVIVIGLGVLSGLIVFRVRAYLRARKHIERSAWEQALIELNELCQKDMMTSENGREFYIRLTAIIKRYLHNRYEYDLLSKTDQELLDYLQNISFDPAIIESIAVIINDSVAIKFAHAKTVREHMERDVASAIMIIKKTIPFAQKRN